MWCQISILIRYLGILAYVNQNPSIYLCYTAICAPEIASEVAKICSDGKMRLHFISNDVV